MHAQTSFFQARQAPLLIAASVYVLTLIASHISLPVTHIWVIAAIFSILMNFTYLTEAVAQGRFIRIELAVTVVLVVASVLGVLVHPLFVIGAIFGHGFWDVAKQMSAGVPFFSWYTLGCCAVDITYGTALLLYWLGG